MGEEPNHTTARKPDPILQMGVKIGFCLQRFWIDQCEAAPLQRVANQWVEWGGRFHRNQFKTTFYPTAIMECRIYVSALWKELLVWIWRMCPTHRGIRRDDVWMKLKRALDIRLCNYFSLYPDIGIKNYVFHASTFSSSYSSLCQKIIFLGNYRIYEM